MPNGEKGARPVRDGGGMKRVCTCELCGTVIVFDPATVRAGIVLAGMPDDLGPRSYYVVTCPNCEQTYRIPRVDNGTTRTAPS